MKKILIIGLVWPEPTSSAAGWRMLQLIKLFSYSYEVHFASSAGKSDYSHDLVALGVHEHSILLNHSSFDKFISQLQPDAVLFDRFMIEEQYGWRVAEYCPNALRILDTEDLHFLRLARQEAYKKNQPLNINSDTAKREIASILRSDISLIISENEMEVLQNEFNIPPNLLYYLPFQEDEIAADRIDRWLNFEERKHFVFIGNFIHEPNWRTVEILKNIIWPVLRKKVPSAELHVYGSYASEKVFQLHKPQEGFYIKGRAGNARQVLERYRVLLAPIPFGAGVKGKLIDSIQAGTPSVSSSIGAESMSTNGKWNGFICDEYPEFVEMGVALYNHRELWYTSQRTGVQILNERYANTTYGTVLLSLCTDKCSRLIEDRNTNFMGQILRQQHHQATKYMALWIAEKNKKAQP
ncbi:glycosyltransferase family 4 protein [Sphingobacterium alkalisoli]|uniref:Glycosyltransferase family 4 protein n=1 Tax=Sphingobacterium alkalisoli TaxID=1874115 RepID=A0A4U0H7S3_9SPHI|nr:glycosyltransferase [Sphingobacterium alkalisoli]TJY67811.1 glycosyltransferase family 4 protein [Sphingobacterium alkalisoli]GGH11212.1 glycosyl transferase [Sphingobacterium alkalisoli]